MALWSPRRLSVVLALGFAACGDNAPSGAPAGDDADAGGDGGTETGGGARDGGAGDGGAGDGGTGDGGTGSAVDYPAWPTFGGVAKNSKPIHTDMVAPGYLEWVVDPRSAPPHFTDGRIPTEVARITDASAFGLASGTSFLTSYSKVSPWNADGTLAVVFYRDPGGTNRAALLDGKSFVFKKLVGGVFPGGRWSMTQPKLWVEPASGGVARFNHVNVDTGDVSVFKDFAADGYVRRVAANLYAGEGNQSNDDRIWAFNLEHRDRGWELVIWDSVADTITGRIPTPGPLGGGTVVDWWTSSQKGAFIVTQSKESWTANGVTIPRGDNVWSLSGEYLRTVSTDTGHLDVCLDEDGNDVLGFIGSKYASNDKVAQTRRLDGSDGESRAHLPDGHIGWAYHLNCRSTARPGMMMVASSMARPVSSYDVFPMWNHLFAVQMNGTGEPGVIGNSHHSDGGESSREYDRSPFGPVNRDFTAVLFGADWDAASSKPIMLYVARPKLN